MQPVEYLEGYADRLVRSFGRTKNRKISPDKQEHLVTLLSTYGIQSFADIETNSLVSAKSVKSCRDMQTSNPAKSTKNCGYVQTSDPAKSTKNCGYVQTSDPARLNDIHSFADVSASYIASPNSFADVSVGYVASPNDIHAPMDVATANLVPIILEIGFGFGEHLWQFAQQFPQTLCIGCETYINGVANLALLMEQCPVANLRVYHGDARKLMVTIPDEAIQQVFLLFPDPWPKNAHRKRRILNTAFCKLLQRVLRPGGQFVFATDHPDYAQQLLQTMQHYPRFSLAENSRNNPFQEPAGWIPTRYQQKSLAGQPQFFIFTKE